LGMPTACGTKFVGYAISKALRQELVKDNVRVTVIEPGAVETELPDHITGEEASQDLSSCSSSSIPSRQRT
jgi:NADP-dependent 3-hydroxy acid dehydrogenase YdfG